MTLLPPRWARSQSTAGAEAAQHHQNPARPRCGAMRCGQEEPCCHAGGVTRAIHHPLRIM